MPEWTSEAPTEPGAYWLYNEYTDTVEPVLIARYSKGPKSKELWMSSYDKKGPWTAVAGARVGISWYGPITPPEPPDADDAKWPDITSFKPIVFEEDKDA
jgi:hypothetical protein